jgi:hypothetical protein
MPKRGIKWELEQKALKEQEKKEKEAHLRVFLDTENNGDNWYAEI